MELDQKYSALPPVWLTGSRLKKSLSFVEQGFDCVKGTAETIANVRPM
jgi:hypothetical protein